MEKIYLLCFTKSDFLTGKWDYDENNGGGYPIIASSNLKFLEMKMKEYVKVFVLKRLELLKKIQDEDSWFDDFEVEEIEKDVDKWIEEGYNLMLEDGTFIRWQTCNYGWWDEPTFFIQEIGIK